MKYVLGSHRSPSYTDIQTMVPRLVVAMLLSFAAVAVTECLPTLHFLFQDDCDQGVKRLRRP
jgi:hypothetical protein